MVGIGHYRREGLVGGGRWGSQICGKVACCRGRNWKIPRIGQSSGEKKRDRISEGGVQGGGASGEGKKVGKLIGVNTSGLSSHDQRKKGVGRREGGIRTDMVLFARKAEADTWGRVPSQSVPERESACIKVRRNSYQKGEGFLIGTLRRKREGG